jgi:choline-sulfatase
MKRLVLACLAAGLMFACRGEALDSAGDEGPPNLLLLTLDTTRADRLGCYGERSGTSPHLDALASRGALFQNAIAPLALTRPSHATIMTGVLPQRHGVWSNGPYRLDASHPTLAERLESAGFSTAAVVSSFVLTRSFGLGRGFQDFDDHIPEKPDRQPEKTAAEVVDSARGWLSGGLREPFFLWLHFFDPHAPYAPPEPWASRFAGHPYEGEIAAMDAAIGEALRLLEAEGRLARTLVVVVGDHGEGLGDHGEGSHGYYLYDSTVRVPLILAGPGVRPGRVVKEGVRLVDLMPTLLDALDIEPGARTADGISFWTKLEGDAFEERPAVLENRSQKHQFGWAIQSGLRFDGWKWIRSPEPELYDLRDDPGETRNLAGREPDRAAALERERIRLVGDERAAPADQLTPEENERLRSLGYVVTDGPPPTHGPEEEGPDPKHFRPILDDIETLLWLRPGAQAEERDALVDTILRADPQNRHALRMKGQMLLAHGKHAEALIVLERLATEEDTHPETFADLSAACAALGRTDDSLRWLLRATTPPWIHWPSVETLSRFARQHPERLKRDEVLARLRGLEPVSVRETVSLARAFALLSATPEAKRLFEQALAIEPGATEARVGLAQMQLAEGRRDVALRTLQQVRPPTVESLFVTGLAQFGSGPRAEACTTFARVREMDPHNANLLVSLGHHLAACGDAEAAAEAWTAVLQGEPKHADALLALAKLEDGRGASGRARELYQRFLAVAPPVLARQRRAAEKRLAQLEEG